MMEWLAKLVWVPSRERDATTLNQLRWAKWYRRISLFVVLFVPLAVSSATVAPILWRVAVAKTTCAPSIAILPLIFKLVFAIALSTLYAWYAGFITHILILAPPPEKIRPQDVVIPGLLITAYVLFTLHTYLDLYLHGEVHEFGLHLFVFPILYIFFLLRDWFELRETDRTPGQHAATKTAIREIWLVVDLAQVIVAFIALLGVHRRFPWLMQCETRDTLMGIFRLEDLTVFFALIGWALVYWVAKSIREAHEAPAFKAYADLLEEPSVPAELREALAGMAGESYTLFDLGCSDGRRTKEILAAIGTDHLETVIGYDWSHVYKAAFDKNLKDLVGKEVNFKAGELTATLVSKPIILHISHLSVAKKRERREVTTFIKELAAKQFLRGLIWRGPAPGSLSHTAAALGGGDYFASPPLVTVEAIFIKDLPKISQLQAIKCNPEKGIPTAVLGQILQLDHSFEVMEWLSSFLPTRIADRVEHWLQQLAPSIGSIADNDAVYLFAPQHSSVGSPSTAAAGAAAPSSSSAR